MAAVIRVCIAGVTGWAGSELARAVVKSSDLELVSGTSRAQAGRTLGQVFNEPALQVPVFGSVAEALRGECDVLVEYTNPESAKTNVLTALARGCHVVVGTSGLTEADFAEIGTAAHRASRAVLACGNFALTAVLLQRFAKAAARLMPQWEIIDYAGDAKPDAPSGTARELAAALASVRSPELTVPISATLGPRDARGATLGGTQVHSLRLPGYVVGVEVIFGMPDQRLAIRHDAGNSARPYVDGALLAIRKVSSLEGLHRGLDAVLDAE